MPSNKIKMMWAQSYLKAVLDKIREDKSPYSTSLLFDGIFIFVVYLLSFLFDVLLAPPDVSNMNWLISLVRILLIITAYSTLKFMALLSISDYFKENKQLLFQKKFSRGLQFLGLNFSIFAVLIIIALVIRQILVAAVREESILGAANIAFLILMLIFYVFGNLSQSFFMHGMSIWKSISSGMKSLVMNIRSYAAVYLVMLCSLVGLGIVFSILDLILRAVIRGELFSQYLQSYLSVLIYISLAILALVNAFNRVYFLGTTAKLSKKINENKG